MYLGTDVYEGAYAYRGMRIVPGWGGSRFEELMPDVFVPEATWAPRSWGLNHPLHIRAQREHGLLEARIRTLRHRLDTAEIVEQAIGEEVGIGSVEKVTDEEYLAVTPVASVK